MIKIAGIQRLTLLDYPGKTAAILFTPGCNLRCPYCHNSDIVTDVSSAPVESLDEIMSFLKKRQGLLDGVCISGGEPLLHNDLPAFCTDLKSLGYAVKLDTNGTFPEKLKELVEEQLVDYVAMDVKHCRERYVEAAGLSPFFSGTIHESIDYLLDGHVSYEFRTTVVRELHDLDSLIKLAEWIRGADAWHLQSFVDCPTILNGVGTLSAYTANELQSFLPKLQAIVPSTYLRGI